VIRIAADVSSCNSGAPLQQRATEIKGKALSTCARDILVVDDDALLRGMVAEWLAQVGYSVREAQDGVAALALLRGAPARLLITDMQMPSLNGAETLAIVCREFPTMPVIAMSGQFDSGFGFTREAAIKQGASEVLAKPFSRDDLLALVRAVIDRT
jgi:DNA-binding response OmpR family regulator